MMGRPRRGSGLGDSYFGQYSLLCINLNSLTYQFLLRNCIKCDYVIKGTPKWARKCCPGSHTGGGLVVPGQGVGVREVRGSNPAGTTHYCSAYFHLKSVRVKVF